eukprot:11098008-Heterocapsa_arctica.AAC.1
MNAASWPIGASVIAPRPTRASGSPASPRRSSASRATPCEARQSARSAPRCAPAAACRFSAGTPR